MNTLTKPSIKANNILDTIPQKDEKIKKEFPRTVIWLSGDGVTASIAARLEKEGVNVIYSLVDDWSLTGWEEQDDPELQKRMKNRQKGVIKSRNILTIIRACKEIKNKENYFVICDTNALYPVAEQFLKMGYEGFLPTKKDYELEKDRTKAKDFVKKNYESFSEGESQDFKKTEEVEKYLGENEDTFYVAKGNNENTSAVVPTTKNPQHNHEIILDKLQGNEDYEKGGMILEEQIQDIVEFTPEAVSFDGKVLGVNIDIENKPVMAGNTGFQTGDSASLSLWISKNEIYDKFLKPMEKMMLRKGQMTVWDASVYYSPSRNKFYFGEFCSNRFGINSIFNELATMPSVSEYFRRIIEGEPLYDPETKKYGVSVRVFNLKHGDSHPKEGDLVLGEDNPDVWLIDTQKENDKTKIVGYDENAIIVTGSGDNLEEAFEKCYQTLNQVSYTDGIYRPKHDVLSYDYPTSIPNRLNVIRGLFEELR